MCAQVNESLSMQTLKDSPGRAGHFSTPDTPRSSSWHLTPLKAPVTSSSLMLMTFALLPQTYLVLLEHLTCVMESGCGWPHKINWKVLFFFYFLKNLIQNWHYFSFLKEFRRIHQRHNWGRFLVCVIRLYSYACLFETTSCYASCPRTHRPELASQMLGLQACVTITATALFYLKHFLTL